jgi:hypothetical protein
LKYSPFSNTPELHYALNKKWLLNSLLQLFYPIICSQNSFIIWLTLSFSSLYFKINFSKRNIFNKNSAQRPLTFLSCLVGNQLQGKIKKNAFLGTKSNLGNDLCTAKAEFFRIYIKSKK